MAAVAAWLPGKHIWYQKLWCKLPTPRPRLSTFLVTAQWVLTRHATLRSHLVSQSVLLFKLLRLIADTMDRPLLPLPGVTAGYVDGLLNNDRIPFKPWQNRVAAHFMRNTPKSWLGQNLIVEWQPPNDSEQGGAGLGIPYRCPVS